MDDEIKTGEMTGEIDESITVEEDFTALEGKAVSISDDSDNKTNEEEVYEEALDIKESLDDIRQQIKDKLLDILEKGKITDADGCEIELLNDQYTEKYNELKDLANTVLPGGKGNSVENTSTTSTTEVVKVNIDYDEILNAINEKADWLYVDEDGQVMLNGEVVPKLKVVELEAEKIKADVGEFKDLTAENFKATNATIENLKANKADIEYLNANYATIQNLNATNANITNLQATKANIIDLNAANANIANLQAIKADITDLNAAKADIKVLHSDVADITTLVNGNLTSDNIQSMVITGDKFTVANGFIKNAMIDSVNANKINAGIINTNNVSIQSDDGSMLLQGNLQQFKDKNGKVRIQIGKDAKGNFTFCLYDENGTGQLINEKGIQSSNAIADGLIVDAKVADNANISGGKIDMSSLFTTMNNSGYTLKSSKIKFDDKNQTLDVAFNNMTTTVKGNTDTLNTHTTSINAMDGKVTQLISDTTITKQDGTTTSLKDAYNATVDTVNSHSTKIGSLETNLATANNNISSVSSKQTALEQNLDGFKQTVSNTYTTKAEFDSLQVGGTNLLLKTKNFDIAGGLNKTGEIYRGLVVRGTNSIPDTMTYICEYTFTDFDYNDVFTFSFYAKGNLTNLCAFFYGDQGYVPAYLIENSVGVKANGAGDGHSDFGKMTSDWKRYWVTWRIADSGGDKSKTKRILLRTDGSKAGESIYVCGCKFEKGNKATEWTPAPQDIDSAITTVDNKFVNYSTTSQMNSAINQKANEITSTVSETYATKASVTDVSNNLKNNYSTTSAMNSAIKQKADSILSTVSNTYATTQSTSALLKESITEYYLSTSNTTLSGGAWGTTPYTPTPGKYIWQRTKSVTNAGDIKYSNPICVSDEMYTVILKNETLLLKCNSDGEVI